MTDLFLKIVNMSISASYIILAVVIARLLLKKAPKWITVLLWGIVAVRLVFPFSIESILSLIPKAETVSPEIMMMREPVIDSGIPVVNEVVNPVIQQSFTPEPVASANPLQIIIPIISVVWLVGIVAMVIYAFVSYWVLLKRIGAAFKLRDNVYQSESIKSPFVMGVIRPKIYLPFNTTERNTEFFIAHESAHIKRLDHLWKPLGFTLLAVYWFNPLMWVAYILLCKDIELACDEKVIANYDNVQRADYSQALLSCSMNRKIITACPIAFGEVSVKDRIKSVLNYKKPALWIIIVAIIAIIATAVCFLTDPVSKVEGSENNIEQTETDAPYIPKGILPELYHAARDAWTELDDQTKKEVLASFDKGKIAKFNEKNGTVEDGMLCLGKFDKCIVFYERTMLTMTETKEVIGYEFTQSSSFMLVAYSEGILYELRDAYYLNLLTKEEVGLVHKNYLALVRYKSALDTYTQTLKYYVPLDDQNKAVFEKALNIDGSESGVWAEFGDRYSGWESKLRCYVHNDKCTIIFQPTDEVGETTRNIDGKKFTFSKGFNLYAYVDGKLYDLKDAYDSGLVRKEYLSGAESSHSVIQSYVIQLMHLEQQYK